MRTCPHCDKEVVGDGNFCPDCGGRLDQPPTVPTIRLPEEPTAQEPGEPEQPVAPAGQTTPLPEQVAAPVTQPYPAQPAPVTPAKPGGCNRTATIAAVIVGAMLLICIALVAVIYSFGRNIVESVSETVVADSTPIVNERATAVEVDEDPPADTGEYTRVLLEDTFDSSFTSELDEDEDDTSEKAFRDGTYVIRLDEPDYIYWEDYNDTFESVSFSVDTTLSGPEDNAASLIFGYQDESNFYIFSVSGDGQYALELYEDNDPITLIDWTSSSAILGTGEVNRLRVETSGDTIRLFVNDELLEETSDSTFTSGQVGVAVNTFSNGEATVIFDNLVVLGPE